MMIFASGMYPCSDEARKQHPQNKEIVQQNKRKSKPNPLLLTKSAYKVHERFIRGFEA